VTTPGTRELVGGRYRLDEVVGRGGMGTVWRGEDRRLHRPVAIKQVLLPAEDAVAEAQSVRRRFLREAHAAARVAHPAVVQVYDVIEEDECLSLVMELVEGPTLSDIVRDRGPLPSADACVLGVTMCDAVAAAHACGVIHRDLKPSNVLVPGDLAHSKLADFGIAATVDDARITRTGLVVGSPSYMAPEQAHGWDSTPATDVWSLAATLYFAVEGVPPFERGGAMPTLAAVVHEPPRPPERAGTLGQVLLLALAKDPAARPSVAELRGRLTRFDTSVPTGPSPAVPDETVADVAIPVAAGGTMVLPAMPQEAAAAVAAGPMPVVHRPHRPRRALRLAVLLFVIAAIVAAGVLLARAESGQSGTPGPTTPTTAATTTTSIVTTTAPPPTHPPPKPKKDDHHRPGHG
jgi:serine/threonine protein kinase